MPYGDAHTTQFGDLVGTVEIDGHRGSPLAELASLTNMPAHYCPIGIEISLFDSFDGIFGFAVLAYDSRETGCCHEEMLEYVATHDELPVRRFTGTLRFGAAHRFIKSCTLVAVDGTTATIGDKLRVVAPDQATFDTTITSEADPTRTLAKTKPR